MTSPIFKYDIFIEKDPPQNDKKIKNKLFNI